MTTSSWINVKTEVLDPLGGVEMLQLLADAKNFKTDLKTFNMPLGLMTLRRAKFEISNRRQFIFSHSDYAGLSCILFEVRPSESTFRGFLVKLLLTFLPHTTMMRECYVLPCSPSDVEASDFKKIFKLLTGIEVDLW